MNSIENINNVFYINLEARVDRKQHVEEQLSKIGLQSSRFNAIKLKDGAVGCSISHLKCLEMARRNNWDHIMIVEDDILFLNPELFKNQLNKFLKNHKTFDVLLIAGNNMPPYQKIDDSCVKVYRCQTTTGYIVHRHYYDTLINNIREGVRKLMNNPALQVQYAIDKYWFKLQEKDNWYLITPLTVTQREDYSDIEKRHTNYTRVMVDLDKEWMFKSQSRIPNSQVSPISPRTSQQLNLKQMFTK
jgi:GR25 family glycosyltransferase involved in LPS biosynthesis